MLFSRLSFVLVMVEWVAIAAGYFMHPARMMFDLFVYGSPIYMAMNLFTHGSALLETSPKFIALLVFHIIKYASIFKAQISDDGNGLRLLAIVLEVAYVAFSGYILY